MRFAMTGCWSKGGLERSVSREVWLKENGRPNVGDLRVELRWNPRENEFAVSSVQYPTIAFNSGVARMRLGCETSVRRTQVVQGADRRWDSIGSGYQPGSHSITGGVGRAAAPGWREFGQAESECGRSDADIRLSTPIKCRVSTPYAIVLKGHRCLLAKVRNRPRTEQLPTGRAPSECTTAT